MQVQFNELYTSFLEEKSIHELKQQAFKLDKLLINFSIKTQQSQGDKLLVKVIQILQEQHLNNEEITLFKAIASHAIQRQKFVSWEGVGLFWSQSADMFVNSQIDDILFSKTIQILTDILYKQSKHRFDPRNDVKAMQKIIQHCTVTYDLIDDLVKIQILILLGAIFKNSASIISQYWQVIFGNNSIISKGLQSDSDKIIKESLKTLNIAAFDSRNVFKQSICMPENFNVLSQSIIQGIAIQQTIEKLNHLMKSNSEIESELLQTYESTLSAINWFNLKPQVLNLLLECGDRIKIRTLILKSLKKDISSLYTFNEFRHGKYYLNIIQRFYQPLAESVKYLIGYYENQKEIWSQMQGMGQSNKFAIFNDFADQYTEELLFDEMLFVSSFMSIYPILGVVIDLAPFQENFKIFIDSEERNIVSQLFILMRDGVQIDEEQDLLQFNLNLLQEFIQSFQHGLNLTLGLLSKTPEKQTTNYQLQFFLVKNDLKSLARAPTVSFVNGSLNQFYEENILTAIQNCINSSVYFSVDYRFYNIIYHTPIQILGLLDDCILQQLQQLVLDTCSKTHDQLESSHYERSRAYYAHQNLICLEMTFDDVSIKSEFIQQTINLLDTFMNEFKNPANLKKPLMQTVGILIQNQLINSQLVEIIVKLSQRQSRVQSTGLRVIGILFQTLTQELRFSNTQITLSQTVSTCLDATNSKDTTFFASVVAIKELYTKIFILLPLVSQVNKLKIIELQGIIFNQLTQKFESVLKNSDILVANQFSVQQSSKMLFQLLTTVMAQPITSQEQIDWVYKQFQSLFTKQYLQKLFEKLDDSIFEFDQVHKKADGNTKLRLKEYEVSVSMKEEALNKMQIYHQFVEGEDGK